MIQILYKKIIWLLDNNSKCIPCRFWVSGLYFCLFLSVCSPAIAQGNNYEISSWFTSSGSTESSGGKYTLRGSMGMPVVGRMVGENGIVLYSSYLMPLQTELGDVDCNGTVGVVDALFILQNEIGRRDATDQCPVAREERRVYLPACDVNGDGRCDSIDALLILQCGVGMKNTFCSAGTAFGNMNVNY